MANYEATRYDFDGANLIGIQGINTGLIIPWSESSIPSGFLECDGTAVSRSTYAALFAVVGTNYGVGDGSTTFNVPDLKDRVCQHKSPTKVFASTGGANTVSATGNISGTIGNTTLSTPLIASHSHPMTAGSNRDGAQGTGSAPGNSGSTGGGSAHDHPASGTFTGDATSVLQPYMALVYIIKT
jgi:microcystin-dependent protein